MRRREFIVGLGGAAAMPLAARPARAQQKLRTIGFLGTGTPQTQGSWLAALVQRLQELNWIDGRTMALEVRWAAGSAERYAEIAAEFVRRKVDVIVTSGSAVPTLMKATSDIPIVFGIDGDPVGRKLVASLARPAGNVTGFSALTADLAGKRLELVRELLPQVRRLGVLGNAAFSGFVQESQQLQATGPTLGIEVLSAPIRRAEDIEPAIDTLKGKVDAVYMTGDALMTSQQRRVNTLSLGARLPTITGLRGFVETGALVSYGPNFPDLHRRAAEYVDRILRGDSPGELPVQQPTKFDLVLNLTTAKVLGVTIPPTLLARADEVIE